MAINFFLFTICAAFFMVLGAALTVGAVYIGLINIKQPGDYDGPAIA